MRSMFFMDTGGDGGQQQFSGIERIGAALEVGVNDQLSVLAAYDAAVIVDASGGDVVFKHLRLLKTS